jgi:hypothetical protein
VLAQLESVDGVAQARVDWTGRSFLLVLRKSSKPKAVVDAAAKVLGPTTRRLESKEEREQIESFVAGAPWLRPGETARMSAHEADVLATRYVTDAAKSVGLDEPRTARLIGLAREELVSLFKKFEQTGLPSRDVMSKEWSALVDCVADRSRDFLTESESEKVFATIRKYCSK